MKTIVYVHKDFKYKNRYLITHDKTKLKGGDNLTKDQEIVFIDTETVPRAKRGNKSKDWLPVFAKIPVGKTWVIPATDKGNGVSTLRHALNTLVEEKKFAKDEFVITQRTQEGKVSTYVSHYETKKPAK